METPSTIMPPYSSCIRWNRFPIPINKFPDIKAKPLSLVAPFSFILMSIIFASTIYPDQNRRQMINLITIKNFIWITKQT
jgi:hypothetical protein